MRGDAQMMGLSAGSTRHEYRTWRVAQHVFGIRADHHLDYPAMAIGADKQQVAVVFFEKADNTLMHVAWDQPEFRLDRVRFEVAARLAQRFLAEMHIARNGDDSERNLQRSGELGRHVHRARRAQAAVVGEHGTPNFAKPPRRYEERPRTFARHALGG